MVGKAPAVTKNLGYERILKAREAEPHNWITYYGGYDGQRYSLLDQINVDNVNNLTPAWVFQAGTVGMQSGAGTYSMEASPIVVDGVMFLTGYDGWVWALDAATGQELWRYKHASPYDISLCCGNVNRGCAVAEGKVFVTTLNAHVLALDAETGTIVWDKVYGDVRAGESATVAPLIVKDMVIVGSSGGEFGVRGHADAFKLENGEHVWRCYMVPKPGEPGSETWPADGDAWQRGGGNCWITPTYDADLNRLYFNTGNPCPDFDGGVREGDNLFTDSVVAVDPDNGQDPRPLPVHPARRVGLRLDDGEHPVRPRREEAVGALRQERVPVHPRSHRLLAGPGRAVRRSHHLGRDRRQRQGDGQGVPRQGRGSGPLLAGAGRRQGVDARGLQPQDRAALRPGAGHRRDGHAAPAGVQGEHPVLGRGRRRRRRGRRRVDQRV